MKWEFDILYALQKIHQPVLDHIMTGLSTIGNAGIFWIVLGLALCIPKKYRKIGIQMVISMAITFIIGNLILKNLIARPRPGLAILYTCIWCSFTIVASYTIGDWLVYMVTGSKNAEVLKNATNYLKFDTLFYFVTAVICVVRNAMQGLGDHITPLVSSSLEMIGKIVIAATLVPWFGYTGVIVAEPLVWFIMVIPLLIQIFRMPVLKNNILTKS